ncbi:MAG: FKBP-type peptidyl-prolyl cis-trans isomerase [Bacteroidales bacterium]|nr:FKBP-type peptidyl-prolyl cis-trans isomerase [Bacteroidales bacterium]
MKRIIKTIAFVASALAVIGCAKAVQTGPNEANERYFNAWIGLNHPGISPTGLGIYVIEEEEGTGNVVKDDGFVYADYIITDLEGNITSYTDKETAKQLGTYDTTTYYGAKVLTTTKNTIYAGLADAIVGMKTGGRKKVIIPSWLMTYASYDKKEDYLDKNSTGTNTIYDITVRDYTDSIQLYEIGQIEKYIKDHPQIFDSRMVNDTTGFYYQPLSKDISTEKFEEDTTIYINYTGRLLNGLVFDTTIEKVAKDNGLYSSTRSYGPTKVSWGKELSDLKLGSSNSSVIDGFARTLWHMHPMEKGLGIFYSPLGYSFNGSGASIPGYSPLIFEIEIVAKPED